MGYEGQCWWITGASSGIGAALAKGLGERGARMILSGRDEARLAEVAGEIATETLILPFDVRDDAALADATAKAIAWKDGVDIAVARYDGHAQSLSQILRNSTKISKLRKIQKFCCESVRPRLTFPQRNEMGTQQAR